MRGRTMHSAPSTRRARSSRFGPGRALLLAGGVALVVLFVVRVGPGRLASELQGAGPRALWLLVPYGVGTILGAFPFGGLLPASFAKVHPRFRTPHVTTVLTCGISAILAGVMPLNVLGHLVSIGTLLAFVIVCLSIIMLRRTQPDLPRPFRTPWSTSSSESPA